MGGGSTNEGSGWSRFRASRWFRPLVIAVPIVVVLGAGLAVYLPWELSKVAVPDLTGQSLSAAADELGPLQLTLQSDGSVDLALAAFTAIDSQDPAPGMRVRPNAVVTVASHLVDVTVPDVTGKSLADATAALKAAGLEPGAMTAQVPPDLPADPATIQAALTAGGLTVLQPMPAGATTALLAPDIGASWPVTLQDPQPGTSVKAGSPVAVTATIPFVPVPDVGGQPHDDAIAALQAAGFDTSEITTDGIVTAQEPAAGTSWFVGAKVGATLRHEVRYEASASFSRGWMQWIAPGASEITVDSNARLPWSMTWWDTTAYGHVVVGPKAVLGSSATASCRILVDGRVVAEQSATGTTPNVTCG